jgi:hypothetical protein
MTDSKPVPQSEVPPREEWRLIEGFDGFYEVSNFGNVRCLVYRGVKIIKPIEPRLLKRSDNGHGYLVVTLSRGGKSKAFMVHRLVITAFVGPCPHGQKRSRTLTCKRTVSHFH